ncbi:MAG TPA: PilZ domain-containing protein [Candidatus Omnitrophota bacterium]|nr:PilZ domain-containing protein [Candidatus Omnitrophota bacterium]HPS20836.1 PilZ domain-containing protein [Candidatus Omnitrophota bacterium]
MKRTTADKRKFPRVNYKCLIKVAGSDGDEEFNTFTQNIGAGGVCVLLKKNIELFKAATMSISLPDNKELVTCKGTVVWVIKRHVAGGDDTYEYDTGIEFTNISEPDRNRIATLVSDILSA